LLPLLPTFTWPRSALRSRDVERASQRSARTKRSGRSSMFDRARTVAMRIALVIAIVITLGSPAWAEQERVVLKVGEQISISARRLDPLAHQRGRQEGELYLRGQGPLQRGPRQRKHSPRLLFRRAQGGRAVPGRRRMAQLSRGRCHPGPRL